MLAIHISPVSHPTWVRGLKLDLEQRYILEPLVAPYVGAWIETGISTAAGAAAGVAPYVGAWIETFRTLPSRTPQQVAPYVGAWIETRHTIACMTYPKCRTLRGCVD